MTPRLPLVSVVSLSTNLVAVGLARREQVKDDQLNRPSSQLSRDASPFPAAVIVSHTVLCQLVSCYT